MRVKEHRDTCNKGDTWKSAIKLKEAIHINRTPANNRLNQDGGYKLPGCWIATMKKLGGGGNHASNNRASASASASNRMGMRA